MLVILASPTGRTAAQVISESQTTPHLHTQRGVPLSVGPDGHGLDGARYAAGPSTEAGTARGARAAYTATQTDPPEVRGTTVSNITHGTNDEGRSTCGQRVKDVARRGVIASVNAAETVVNVAGCVCCCTLSKPQRIGYAIACTCCGLATLLILDDKGVF